MRIAGIVSALVLFAAIVHALEIGDPAPDFSLPDQHGKAVSLKNFRGKANVIVAFYVMAFTPG
jgi:thioredoxin-dependent peroxiredoxin